VTNRQAAEAALEWHRIEPRTEHGRWLAPILEAAGIDPNHIAAIEAEAAQPAPLDGLRDALLVLGDAIAVIGELGDLPFTLGKLEFVRRRILGLPTYPPLDATRRGTLENPHH
jgi:hypothetical protein